MSAEQKKLIRYCCYGVAAVIYCGGVLIHHSYQASQEELAREHAKELYKLVTS